MKTNCFKYIFATAVTASSIVNVTAQTGSSNIPVSPANAPALSNYPFVVNFSSTLKNNYVREWIPDEPTSTQNLNIKYRQKTTYLDGLGRPLQIVHLKGHADGYDIVEHHIYDNVGRESVQFLPFTAQATSSFGDIQYNAKMRIEQFYPPADGQLPYSLTEFDNSPLNRPVKTMAPGKNWVGSNRGTTMKYDINIEKYLLNGTIPTYYTVKGSYPKFSVNSNNVLQNDGYYEEGELYITRVIDEDGMQGEEIKDKSGKVIVKRQLSNIISSPFPKELSPNNYTYTINVYDDFGRLRYVLPPGATTPQLTVQSNTINNITYTTHTYNWTLPTTAQLEGLCFSYLYDGRGRLIERKIPGKAVDFMVYDERDRLVLSQDGNLRSQNKWLMTIHDAQNRPVMTALVNSSDNRTTVAGYVGSSGTYSAPDWRYYASQNDLYHNYPSSINNTYILSYTYYDNYDELSSMQFDGNKTPTMPASGDGSIVPSEMCPAVKGLVTGTKLRVLNPDDPNGNQWITTVQYYDPKGRPIQSAQTNLKGGTDRTGSLYYFQGMAYRNAVWHQNPAATALPGANSALNNIKVEKTFKRNLAAGGNDLVWSIQQRINDGTPFDLAYYDYNHLGQPVIKQFTTTDVLQEYNIRGWVNHIQARKSTNHDVNFFNETIHYDDGFANKLYNGNIAGITWKYYDSLGSGGNNAYGYTYDKLSRLNHAEYRELSQGGTWSNAHKDYTASAITYDDRGNILTMNQRGNITNPVNMDQLQYTYASTSNQLVKVKDNIASTTTNSLPDFKDGADLGIEYSYDDNGNLVSDANKDIGSITYNYLNKPEKIKVIGKGEITYVYDAGGNRLQKKVKDDIAATTVIWDYIGGFVYKDNILQYITNEEGRCRPLVVSSGLQNGSTKFVYDYFIKDHLGNIRSTITAEPINQQYLALHEIATANSEQLIFDNIALVRDDKPGSINPGDLKAAHLIASDPHKRIGTAIMLRVMPGDHFTFGADSYYESDGTETSETPTAEEIVNSLLSTLSGGTVGGVPVSEAGENGSIINEALGSSDVLNFMQDQLNTQHNAVGPKAGLNYLYFDQNLKLIPWMSGKLSVNLGAGQFSNMSVSPTPMTEPGYVVVFVDNNSIGTDVWFDNVQISHFKGQVLEENHYYPFGLTISPSDISNMPEQPFKYNGKELEKSFGLETYEYGARQYDPQIGRWKGLDPLADKYLPISPFAYVANNPIKFIDPDGKFIFKYTDADLKQYGLTRQDMVRFENVVNNAYKVLENNPQAMMALTKSTGLSRDQILNDFKPNQGPKIDIADIKTAWTNPSGVIMFPTKVISNYANIESKNRNELAFQTLGMVVTLIHEYTHEGDLRTNGGNFSGQYSDGGHVENGKQFLEPNWNALNGYPNSIKHGKQEWKVSLTGHRGYDVELVGFGQTFQIGPNGKFESNNVTISPSIDPRNFNINVPQSLPEDMEGNSILETLDIK